ncbi:ATP-binding protein [Meiothermus ruber]|jgi:DNA-binding SARP family transcriptional activator|uniref:SARP family transcriptional regulator n=1 Tax=Meiothermus ruber (strain ATCC 35948 / DSM 1279 / VKM B-1258 / 21) TaxID=504728 RepID=D3PSF9_MEIRD|nr:AAA family ATPase [Meiothermus ruber]ADD28392.1 transcriptional regulator, SARP family [Meiothermus ruber DSM 1279]AGK06167.1 SARP family transcriptional regulator [Meiothermus ruber DSM 1279]MCL6529004.1 AAA family ATPase [Meiothermus ruber]GAO75348.1 SARP family transcriptional regulator [Meiothermus ruber H328]
MALYLSLLGPPQLWADGALVPLLPRKAVAMAAYLAVVGHPVERGRLADLLWEGDEAASRRNLRQELFRLKRTPWEQVFAQTTASVGLGAVETDLEVFLHRMAQGAWAEAAALWRGGFLANLEAKTSENFQDWLIPERERWAGLYREALLGLARSYEAGANYHEALKMYLRLLGDDPLQESDQMAVMRLYLQMGDRAAALRQFEQFRALLMEQLGLELSQEMKAFGAQMLAGRFTAPPNDSPNPWAEPPLVGREADIFWLETHWGQGLLLLLGEAGVGKTRLALEYARRRTRAGSAEVLRIRQRESGQGIGFSAVLEVLRQAYEDRRLHHLSSPWREELAQLLPELGSPPGSLHKTRLFEALCRGLLAIARPGGVVLWDDLQWLDWASLEFLPYLVRRAGRLGLAVLGTSRFEALQNNEPVRRVLQELAQEGSMQQRVLEPIDQSALLDLLRQLSGQQEGGERFAERLFKATEGNVFYVLETLRYLFDQGLLRAEAGAWHTPFDGFTSDYRELPLPPSVRDALLERLKRLGEGVVPIAQALALADFPLPPELAAGLLRHLEAPIEALERLTQSGFLRLDPAGYTLRHELVRQAVLAEMSESRRCWLHGRIANALREVSGPLPQLAAHLEAAGQRAEAYVAHLMAGRSLRRGPLARQALEHYARAQVLCPSMEPDSERFRMLIEAAETRVLLGQLQIPERQEMARLVENLGDPERFRMHLLNADVALASGRVAEGIEAIQEAKHLARTPWQQGHALFKLAWLEYRGGDPDKQLEPLLASIQAFHDIGDPAMETLALRNLSGYWFRVGDLEQHQQVYEQALKRAAQLKDDLLLRRLRADKLMVDWVKGDYAASTQMADLLYQEARERGDWWAVWDALQGLLLNAAVLGLEPTLEATVQRAMVEAAEVGAWRDLALLRSDYGNALMVAGRLEEARRELEAALRDLREMGERARLGHALFNLGFTLLEQGYLEQSRQTLEESVQIWRDRKEYRHTARSLAALALNHLRAGNRKQARQISAEAHELRAPWALGIYDLPLVLYARARALGDKQGADLLAETQSLLHNLAQQLPPHLAERLLQNRYVAWALSKVPER